MDDVRLTSRQFDSRRMHVLLLTFLVRTKDIMLIDSLDTCGIARDVHSINICISQILRFGLFEC